MDQRICAACVSAMAGHQVEIDRADGLFGHINRDRFVPQEIGEIDHAELAERDEAANGLVVLRIAPRGRVHRVI